MLNKPGSPFVINSPSGLFFYALQHNLKGGNHDQQL